MESNEKLLSVSRFQIGLSKADLQPSAGVCTTQALNKSRWSDFSPAPILEALSLEPSGPSCAMEICFTPLGHNLDRNDKVNFNITNGTFTLK